MAPGLGLPNKVLAAEYKLALPDPKALAEEIARTRRMLDAHRPPTPRQVKQRK